MSDRKIVDLTLARLRRRHDAATRKISDALGFLRQDVATLQDDAEAIVTGLTVMTGTLESCAAEAADTARFCHACQAAWNETDLDALIRVRDRLAAELAARVAARRPISRTDEL